MEASAGPSLTAVMTAVARALHREGPLPWVLDDPFGMDLAGELGEEICERLRSELPQEGLLAFSRWCCVRSRFPEDLVERELLANGVDQYVILGAGLDTFAVRRPELMRRLRVFEVDHPASQRWKRERLDAAELSVGPNLVFAPIDFERQRLDAVLRDAGFDFDSPAVFSWIGVTMFLTLAAISDTLDQVAACADGTRLALTYNQPQRVLGRLGTETQGVLSRIVAGMDEPMITFFTPSEIEALLGRHGFGEFVHVGPDEARSLYYAGRPDVAFGGAQRLIAGTVRRGADGRDDSGSS